MACGTLILTHAAGSADVTPAPYQPRTTYRMGHPMIQGFPKPIPRKIERQRLKRTRAEHISRVRSAVVSRDGKCRSCGERGRLEMHEVRSRAQLRGKHFTEIFTLQNCLMLCRECHRKVTEHRLDITICDKTRGCNGQVHVSISQSKGGYQPPRDS